MPRGGETRWNKKSRVSLKFRNIRSAASDSGSNESSSVLKIQSQHRFAPVASVVTDETFKLNTASLYFTFN